MAELPADISWGDLGIYGGDIPRRLDTVDVISFLRLAWDGRGDDICESSVAAWNLLNEAHEIAVKIASLSPDMRRAFWVLVDTIRDAPTRLPAQAIVDYVRTCDRTPFTAPPEHPAASTPPHVPPPLKADHPAASKARKLRVIRPGQPGYDDAGKSLL